MTQKNFSLFTHDRLTSLGIGMICLTGIALRLVFYFQNNDLIIDEANIARNLAERDFGTLLSPLRYEQYAPPVFLWIEKTVSLVLGFSEKALRLYPLLSGMAALFVLLKILQRLGLTKGFWYPMSLLALGTVYIKHSVEVKQYMPDALISLLLILLALTIDIRKSGKWRFLILWILTGSLAVWTSMPSVFVLAGVGGYYASIVLAEKRLHVFGRIIIPSLFWLIQFVLYYEFILKRQITSSYLQNYHQHYFLFALPASPEEWMHNGRRMLGFLGDAGGFTFLALLFNGSLSCVGIVHLLKKNKPVFLLLIFPLVSLFAAATLHHYALVERLILFSLPLVLILFGFGLEPILQQWHRVIVAALILVALICINNYAMLHVFYKRDAFHEITEGLNYLKQKHINGDRLFIHHSSGDSYLYYLQLHPEKESWKDLSGATILKWDADYSLITRELQDTVYFLYTGGFPPEERQNRVNQIEVNMKQVDYFEKYVCYVFGYAPKESK